MSTKTPLMRRLASELGFSTLRKAPKDIYVLLIQRYLRMIAYGSSTLILALFFKALNYSDESIGFFMSATLGGDVLLSLVLTFIADAVGRRFMLFISCVMMVGSGFAFALDANYWVLLAAAVFGVISPSGNEIGPFRAIEEATLAQLSDASTRSDIFAWYVVVGSLGTATGSFGGGWLMQYLENGLGWRPITAYKFMFFIYIGIGIVKGLLCCLLSRKCEVQPAPAPPQPVATAATASTDQQGEESDEDHPLLTNGESSQNGNAVPPPAPPPTKKSSIAKLSRKSTIVLAKLCGIFFFDSLASGMVPFSLIAYFMYGKFQMPEGQLGTIVSAAQFTSSIGSLFASAVAKRIGFVRAMVFTHLPSAILLALVPAPTSLILTVIILVARSSLSSMDQAPRSAFLAAVVLPEERTATMGIVNTVKTLSQSSGPLITGVLAGNNRFWIAFVAAGALKIFYDLAMLTMFVNLKLEGDLGSKASRASTADARGQSREEAEQQFALDDSDDDSDVEPHDRPRDTSMKLDKLPRPKS